jgi:predicted metal-binding protein
MVSRERGSDVDFRTRARWVAMLTCGGCDLKLTDMGMGILKRYVRYEEGENT